MAQNPNGYIAIVFTYNGTTLASYSDFLDTFYVTLPGGGGVQLGADQYFGYVPGASESSIALGQSYPLSKAASAIAGLLPTNAAGNTALVQAFQGWAESQAAAPGQPSYANLYLDHFTGGRIYLSNGDLGLGSSGEPVPTGTSDPAYGLVYDLFEPFIGAQVNNPNIPGNGADITDIDWFSFPITLKVWYYDFGGSGTALTSTVSGTTTVEQGGDGASIYESLLTGSPTNGYPNASLPTEGGSSQALRLAGPTAAAASQSYYTDPAQDPFPYHYFDDYLTYLASHQGESSSLFTLTGAFAGTGGDTPDVQAQTFTFNVDFRNVKTGSYSYPSGSVTQILPGSTIVLTGHTSVLGSESAPLSITLPWAVGQSSYSLNWSNQISDASDAIAQGWLSVPSTAPTAPSGTYSPITATALDAGGHTIPTQNETSTQLQLIFSVNTDPLSGTFDDLYQGGQGTALTIDGSGDGTGGLTLAPNAHYTQVADGQTTLPILIITADGSGGFGTIQINDLGAPSATGAGTTWTIAAGATGLGNNQPFTVKLNNNPPLRNAFVLNTATYLEAPASLSMTAGSAPTFSLGVTTKGLAAPGWVPDTTWTTLSQPAGIYGANAGYTIAGLSEYNGDVKSLQNDVFGWAVADLLAALNAGLVGSPVEYPPTRTTIGQSSASWFASGQNPYTMGLWGGAAWAGQTGSDGKPVDDFWNTWAYDLATVAGGTDAYGFAFTDRFGQGILVGFNPPPAEPSGLLPVLLEVIVGDSPLLTAAVKSSRTR